MSRNDNVTVEPEVEETVADTTSEATEAEKPAKAKKEPVRGDLPEGYVTPIGLAKALSEQKLYLNRDGVPVEVKPQIVYSYIKNAPEAHPFPMEKVTDSLGKERQALKLQAGLDWWNEKNARTAERKANAADKASKKAEKAAAKATDETVAVTDSVEAE